MTTLNQSKNIVIIDPEDLPRDPGITINKNWLWKDGFQPPAGDDGLIPYTVIDSNVLGNDGKPAVKIKHLPEEYAGVTNGVPGLRSPYPAPCEPLAEDEELYVAGPGIWGIRKKTAIIADPILAALDRIERKIDKILEIV